MNGEVVNMCENIQSAFIAQSEMSNIDSEGLCNLKIGQSRKSLKKISNKFGHRLSLNLPMVDRLKSRELS